MPDDQKSLDILLRVSANVAELTGAVRTMQQGFARVEDAANSFAKKTNAALEAVQKKANGFGAAISQVLGSVFAASRLKQFAAESIEAARAVAQLEQALRETGQFTPAYRDELLATAKALQQLTGFSDEAVIAVQQFLVQGGIGREQIRPLTEAVLDLAASMRVDALSAARLIANTLQGTGDSLGKFAVNLEGAITPAQRAQRVLEELAARGVRGSAAAAFASAAPELQRFRILIADLRKEVGRLTLALSTPFLKGFTEGLKDALGVLTALAQFSPRATASLTGFSQELGRGVGQVAVPAAIIGAVVLLAKKFEGFGLSLAALQAPALGAAAALSALNVALLATATAVASFSLGTALREVEAIHLILPGWLRIIPGVGSAIDRLRERFPLLRATVGDVIEAIVESFRVLLDYLQGVAVNLAARVGRLVLDVILAFWDQIEPFLRTVAGALARIGVNIDVSGLDAALTQARERLQKSIDDNPLSPTKLLADVRRALTVIGKDIEARGQPAPAAPVGKDVTPLLTGLARTRALQQEINKAATASLAIEEFDLQQSYEARLVSTADYIRRRGELLERALQADEKSLFSERARIRQALANTPDTPANRDARQRLLEQEAQLSAKLEDIRVQRELGYRQIAAAGAARDEQDARARAELEVRIAEAGNQQLLAARLKLNAELDELQRAGLPAELIAAYRQAREAQLALEAATENLTAAEQRYNQTLDTTKNLLATGQITRTEAVRRNAAAAAALENALRASAAQQQTEIARLTPPPEFIGPIAPESLAALETARLSLADINARIAELNSLANRSARDPGNIGLGIVAGFERAAAAAHGWGEVASDVAERFATGFAEATANAFDAFIAGTASAAAAFRSFAADFLREIAKMIIQQTTLNALQRAQAAAKGGSGPFGILGSFFGLAGGGPVRGPGGPTDDRVPIAASAGEWVINARAVSKYGHAFMAALNAGVLDASLWLTALPHVAIPRPSFAYATGGPIASAGAPLAGRLQPVVVQNTVVIGNRERDELFASAEMERRVLAIVRSHPRDVSRSQSSASGFND